MIRDTFTTFASDVASGDAGTRQFGDVIDLKGLGAATNVGTGLEVGGQRDAGGGQNVRVIGSVSEEYEGSATVVTFSVVTSDNPNLTSGVTLLTSPAINVTDMLVGAVVLNAVLPTEGSAYKRYLGVTETVVGTTTTGKANFGIQLDDYNPKIYSQADIAF